MRRPYQHKTPAVERLARKGTEQLRTKYRRAGRLDTAEQGILVEQRPDLFQLLSDQRRLLEDKDAELLHLRSQLEALSSTPTNQAGRLRQCRALIGWIAELLDAESGRYARTRRAAPLALTNAILGCVELLNDLDEALVYRKTGRAQAPNLTKSRGPS